MRRLKGILFIVILGISVKCQGQLIPSEISSSVFAKGLEEIIRVKGEIYKIDGFGYLIIDIENIQLAQGKDNALVEEISMIVYPAYETDVLIERPPFEIIDYENHLFCIYTGAERLLKRRVEKRDLKKYRRYFSDLNGVHYLYAFEMMRIRLNGKSEEIDIENDIRDWRPWAFDSEWLEDDAIKD